ncbi:RNA polymerase sigma factor [Larkinella soli]|uniref:RNA polymerase sigma factor n=1 Tax=Larkinella soli TaxID=1770527 RepID=UPI000FFB1E23|nr:sigma-70 family RNA polymerase sigma factor [Larkinella soli]
MNREQRISDENETLLELWRQARAGDKAAYCRLADSQYRTLFNYATNFTADREVIKDALQDLFIHIWERRQSITIQYVSIYFLRALRNQLLQEFRRSKRTAWSVNVQDAGYLTDFRTVETDIEQGEAVSEHRRKLHQAIGGLPKRQQEVVFLKFYEGLENEQIAEVMHINRQSVANLLFKAISTLRGSLLFSLYTLLFLLYFFVGNRPD